MENAKSQKQNSPESTTTHDMSTMFVPAIDEMSNFIKQRTPQHTWQEPDYHFSNQSQKRQPSYSYSPPKKRVRQEGAKIMETAGVIASSEESIMMAGGQEKAKNVADSLSK